MIITCGQCLAKFKVAPEQIKESGSKVRCSNCQHVFTVYRPGFEPDDREIDRPPLFYQPQDKAAGDDADMGDGPSDDLYGHDESAGLFHGDGSYEDEETDYDDDQEQYDDEDGPEDEDNYYTAQYGARTDDGDSLSARERRDRRRSLYADLGEEDEGQEDDELYYDEDEMVDEDGRPPLRRASARAAKSLGGGYGDEPADDEGEYEDGEGYEDDGEEYEDEEAYEYDEDDGDDYGDSADEDEYEDEEAYEPPSRQGRRAALGLTADPRENMVGYIDDADYRAPGLGRTVAEGHIIRSAITKVAGRQRLPLIIAAGAAVLLLIVLLIFFFGRSAPTALSTGEDAPVTPSGPGPVETDTSDSAGTNHISFTRGTQNHYLRQNEKAGQILIITGLVRNSYPGPRSYIRLRGHLLSQDGTSLADRFVYAGNILTEEDLAILPMNEILSRLSYRGGTDSKNINIPPDVEIPFMIVFDKLPNNMHEYRIDPVGSQPAD